MLLVNTHLPEPGAARRLALGIALSLCAALAACVDEPPPRSFTEFMDDRFAREGTLVRCNTDRVATANDPECINARRAAAALAAQAAAAQREQREAQSEARLLAARRRQEAMVDAERRAEVAAQTEEQRAYEALWDETAAAEPPVAHAVEAKTPASINADSNPPARMLEPIQLPESVKPPLTTIGLPRSAKPMVYEPAEPALEEIVVPDRRR